MSQEKEHFPEIRAKNIEQFKEINELLKKLPQSTLDIIEYAENGLVGTTCHIKKSYKKDFSYMLPDIVTQIQNFGDYVGVYAENYFFRIPIDDKTTPLNFKFIKLN